MKKQQKDCPMRHNNGNCIPNGGFCTSVNQNVCEALQSAYRIGKDDAYKKVSLSVLNGGKK